MSHLFTPLQLGPLALANRIVIAPMCQYAADDGVPGDWHRMHLGQLACSGAGLLIVEATAVSAEGRITPGCLGLWRDDQAEALAAILRSLRAWSTMPVAVQLSHAGRKASSAAPWHGGRLIAPADGGWTPQAPSPLPHGDDEPPPAALQAADLARIRQDFVDAARRAVAAGAQAIELHAAHGYLLHQFLSPLANRRDDAWGGTAERRMRFPLEVAEAVRAALPASVALWVRLSATDWVDGGWDVEHGIAFGRALKALGCAALHVSSGGISPRQRIPVGPGYQVPLAEQLRAGCDLPVIAVGLITEPAQAEAIVAEGRADAVALARAMLFNPHWPWAAAAALGARVQAPPAYWRAAPREAPGLFDGARFGQR